MDTQKQQVAQRVKEANNILVTVSNNPSVDQLAACIGLTLALNKMGKHATAVFSGEVPSTIEFLQPEKTLEKNTDSLRDFIIALDKSKADKLRYKVEDRVVKIFITPYKTSISDKDLEFSQGDFNVDVVLALGVHNQAELDQAITSHGRILHDAAVVTMNVKPGGELGSMNWLDPAASSLSELGVQLLDMLDKKLMDGQIATSMLTGIVAETERFSNAKTSPQTMSISAELMGLGANQQLVATKLEEPAPPPPPVSGPIAHQDAHEGNGQDVPPEDKKPDDGTLEISHDEKADESAQTREGEAQPPANEGAEGIETEREAQPETPPAESTPEQPLTPLIHDIKSDHDGMLPPPDEHHDHYDDEHDSEDQEAEEEHQGEAKRPEESDHAGQQAEPVLPAAEMSIPEPAPAPPQIHIDEHGALSPLTPQAPESDAADEALLPPAKPQAPPTISHHNEAPKMVLEPPTLGGQLNVGTQSDAFGASGNDEDKAAGLPGMPEHEMPMLGNGQGLPGSAGTRPADNPDAPPPPMPAPSELPQNAPGTAFLGDQPLEGPNPNPGPGLGIDTGPQANLPAIPDSHETLSDIERDVHSSHVADPSAAAGLPDGTPAVPTLTAPFPAPEQQAPPPAAPQIPVVHPDDLTPDEMASAFAVGNSPPSGAMPQPPAIAPDAASFDPIVPSEPSPSPVGNPEPSFENGDNGLGDARDAVAQAISGAAPSADAMPPDGNGADTLADAPPPAASATPVAGSESAIPPPAPPPVRPWMPPAEAELTTVPNPATQFDPAAFSQDDNQTVPPPGPPPMAPPHMPGT
jgi:hypothetical protein